MNILLIIGAVLAIFGPKAADGIAEGIVDVDIIGGLVSGISDIFTDINTTDVQIDYMMGKWHQMYKAAINFNVFRTNMYCHVAYFKRNLIMGLDGFSVEEAYHVYAKDGPIEAYLKDATRAGPGRYWMYPHEYFYPHQFFVIQTGPVVNDSYQYLVATDQNKLALNVLARDPEEFIQLYEDDVIEFLQENRFGNPVFWNEPKEIYQGSDCYYPSAKEVHGRREVQDFYNRQQARKQGGTGGGGGSPLQSLFGAGGLGKIVSSPFGRRRK